MRLTFGGRQFVVHVLVLVASSECVAEVSTAIAIDGLDHEADCKIACWREQVSALLRNDLMALEDYRCNGSARSKSKMTMYERRYAFSDPRAGSSSVHVFCRLIVRSVPGVKHAIHLSLVWLQ